MKHLRLPLVSTALAATALLQLAPPAAALNLGTQPLYLGGSIPPYVMLITPKDHQLFKKAYDDFSDLDSGLPGGDSLLETTYKHAIDYYGYFDSFKCYNYSSASSRFIPASNTADKYCAAGSAWSGNFLNWVAMSRIDVMRKLMYGGFRSTDSNGTTVLERALVPIEGHSWAKHYRGADLPQLVPFSTLLTAPRTYNVTTAAQAMIATGTRSFTVDNANTLVHPLMNGDQVTVCVTAAPTRCMHGRVTTEAFGATASVTITIDGAVGSLTPAASSWVLTNHSSAGITICNATQAINPENSQTSTKPPLMRAAAGDYNLWGVGEGTSCRWSDETGGSNANVRFFSELNASSASARRSGTAPTTQLNNGGITNGDYTVRILACDSTLIGSERCTQYPNGNFKPTGLLQDYAAGQQKKIKFGLMSGSYTKNKSGGVLRKNIDFLDSATSASPSLYNSATDEIDAGTGIFNTTAATPGIIATFNKIKLYGYLFPALGVPGTYGPAGASALNDNCTDPGIPIHADNSCTSWGNPISEIYAEAVRYFAGKAADATYTFTQGGSKDELLGLLQPAWVNPLTATNYCTPLNVIVMNSSVNSYDNDQFTTDLFPGGVTAQTVTKTVGDHEGITGSSFLIGNNGATNNGLCTPKNISDLGLGFGVCPEAPALGGSYRIAGVAHWAKNNRIRAAFGASAPPASDTRALKVTSYGIALASGAPKMEVPVPGSSPTRFITILPASRTFNPSTNDRGGGAIVDFKMIRQDLAAGTGKFFVSWENAQQGSDYDFDVWGTIEYRFITSNTQIEVTTDVLDGSAGSSTGFGYVISGTTNADGMHFHSGFKGGSNTIISYHYPTGFNTSTSGNNECNDCTLANPPSAKVYNVSATAAATLLKEPLFYMSKYGGFVDQNANGRPDLVTEWDSKNNLTGADGTDGLPDTYFPVTNPGALEAALDRAFISVLQVSSASSVATNSTSLQSGSIVYQARFNANEWSGQLLAFGISATGAIDPVPLWDASQLMPSAATRTMITYRRRPGTEAQGDVPKGVPFRWTSLNSLQQADLNKNATGTPDPAGTECTGVTLTGFTPAGCSLQGQLRLNWLRGDPANEGATATKYRVRPTTKLGDIVNSTPMYVGPSTGTPYTEFGPPAAAYTADASYSAFIASPAVANRTPIIYAAGNDGMLHGFDASTGAGKGVERLAYVPSTSYRHFTKLTDKTYSHRYYVDGSPTVADVKFSDGTWHTILVGGLNAGGQGVYALDITNPAAFSEGNADSLVLWEWNDFNDDWTGNTYSQPTVAKMANGKFAVIFGNGYNNSIGETGDTQVSISGCATLYILFVDGGIDGVWSGGDFHVIDVPVSCNPANPNGLATPRAVDVDNDGVADYIYAGDLRGNLWKFDVRGPGVGGWSLANGATPLFAAVDSLGNPQPITAAATTFPNSAAPGTTMVLFGTGKYLEQIDDSPPFSEQSFYGIWDKHDGTVVTRSQLLRQKILGASVANPLGLTLDNVATPGVDESGFRISTPYSPNYTAAPRANAQFGESNASAADEFATSPPHRGWYMDLPFSGDGGGLIPGTGERVVFRPVISTGKLVFTTLVPSTQACQFGGTSILMDLNPVTGGRLTTSPFDVNNDSNFTSGDFIMDPAGNLVAVSGRASTIGIVPTPTVIQMSPSTGPGTPGKEVKVLSGSSGQLISILELGAAPSLPGAAGRRILWRQLFTD